MTIDEAGHRHVRAVGQGHGLGLGHEITLATFAQELGELLHFFNGLPTTSSHRTRTAALH